MDEACFFWSVQRCFGRDTDFWVSDKFEESVVSFGPMRSILFCSASRLSRFISYSDSDWSQFRVKYARVILPLDDKNTRLHQTLHKATLG